jgi:hypothetical protein
MQDKELDRMFQEMTSSLEEDMKKLEFNEEDISQWPVERLVERLAEIDQQLIRAHQLLAHGDHESRKLHSERTAIIVALRNGGFIG